MTARPTLLRSPLYYWQAGVGVVIAHLAIGLWLSTPGSQPTPAHTPPMMVELLTTQSNHPTPATTHQPPRPAQPTPSPRQPARPTPHQEAPSTQSTTAITTPAHAPALPVTTATSTPAVPVSNSTSARDAAPAAPPVIGARFDADYLSNPAPPYPPLARRLGEEGKVVLRVQVSAEGNATQVEIRSSSGFPRLDQSALDTVRRWRFVPARQGDKPLPSTVLVPIVFKLDS